MSNMRNAGRRTLRQPGMWERIYQLFYLLKNTASIVGRDPGIVKPTMVKVIYGIVEEVIFFAGLVLILFGQFASGIGLVVLSVLLYTYKYLFHARMEMRQSWLASEIIQGRSGSKADAIAVVKKNKRVYRIIGVLNFFGKRLEKAQRKGKSGFLGIIVRLFFAAAMGMWDLVSHYLLPAAVVDGYGFSDGIDSMGRLKNHVPESLTGVFGIDVAGHAVGALMSPIYFLLTLGGIALAWFVGDAIPIFYVPNIIAGLGLELPPDLPYEFISWNVLPLLVLEFIAKFMSIVVDRVTSSFKVLYFTLFYMRITHNERIASDMRESLDSYLTMQK